MKSAEVPSVTPAPAVTLTTGTCAGGWGGEGGGEGGEGGGEGGEGGGEGGEGRGEGGDDEPPPPIKAPRVVTRDRSLVHSRCTTPPRV